MFTSKRIITVAMIFTIIVLSFGMDTRAAGTVTVDWIRQFSSYPHYPDVGTAISAENTGVYVAGVTQNTLPGQSHFGGEDAFVRKYALDGTELWTQQFGTIKNDLAYAIAADGSDVYVVGYTSSTLPGQVSSGAADVFIRKYDMNGTEVWTRQFGATGSSPNDLGFAVAVNSSGVFVGGITWGTYPGQASSGGTDCFVRKYDLNGNEVWTRQFGSPTDDNLYAIATDGVNVYLTGHTPGTLPGQTSSGGWDTYVRMYDQNGVEVWTRQFGAVNTDSGSGIAFGDSGVYVVGYVIDGALPGQTSSGYTDAFVRKYDLSGTEIWTRQFSSTSGAPARSVAADSSGIYITGTTGGTFPGLPDSASHSDVYVRKYDHNGTEVWTHQLGTYHSHAEGWGIAVESSIAYVAGATNGALPGQIYTNGWDAFVARLSYDDGNQVPLADAGGPYYGMEGAAIPLDGMASSDPDADSLIFTWSVDSPLCTFSDAALASPTLTCADNGSFTVTLDVSDGQESNSAFTGVQVGNLAPSLSPIAAPVDPLQINTAVNVTAVFTDPGTLDTHTALWDWGDGNTTAGSVNETGGSGTVSDSHTFTAPGVYALVLTLADKDGDSAVSTYQYVVVYHPDGGFVTGGGWIQSPLGACLMPSLCTDVEGKATFGFVSKYHKGATKPSGNTQFHFNAGEFIFKSDDYDWLVVNQDGANAQFKGSGLVNEQLAPNGAMFKFLIWAGDGTGSGGEDTFRIKIWYEDGGVDVVVYDNGTDQQINGGQIKVHK